MNYLEEEYGFIKPSQSLISVDQIKEFFKDEGYDYFECGQGFYINEVKINVFLEGKSYEVTVKGEIASAKQDRGDRLFWVEKIISVTYKEIETPLPKLRKNYKILLKNVTKSQYELVLKAINKITI